MENIYLKFPTLEDKEKWFEYIEEFQKSKPLGYSENTTYEEWLEKIEKEHNGINLQPGRVPSSVYFLIDGDKIVANLSLRHNINTDFLSQYGGHIGYTVRPSERRKGYGTTLLNLALEKCAELGLEDVMVTCKENNIGSAKVIENNCGVLKETIFIPEENATFKKYWINVKEALNKKENIRRK